MGENPITFGWGILQCTILPTFAVSVQAKLGWSGAISTTGILARYLLSVSNEVSTIPSDWMKRDGRFSIGISGNTPMAHYAVSIRTLTFFSRARTGRVSPAERYTTSSVNMPFKPDSPRRSVMCIYWNIPVPSISPRAVWTSRNCSSTWDTRVSTVRCAIFHSPRSSWTRCMRNWRRGARWRDRVEVVEVAGENTQMTPFPTRNGVILVFDRHGSMIFPPSEKHPSKVSRFLEHVV